MIRATTTAPPVRRTRSLSALVLLGNERIAAILNALAAAPMQPTELNGVLLDIPHATLMSDLAHLHGAGAVDRRAHGGLPNRVTYAVTDQGEGLLAIADALATHAASTVGPDGVDCDAATLAQGVDAGWSSSIVVHLGTEPLGASELARRVTSHTLHQVRGRLQRMERAGLVVTDGRRRPRFGLTASARGAMSVVVHALRWQRAGERHPADDSAALAEALMVATSGLVLGGDRDGVVTATVEGPAGASGFSVLVDGGTVTGTTSGHAPPPAAWIRGGLDAWLETLGGERRQRLTYGGDVALARALVRALCA
jgi:DNA-binding HxlR family transcriptional regulator